jgi:hypothetical protein
MLPFSILLAEGRPSATEPIPLVVQVGVPLHVVLEKPVSIKRAGGPVEGRLIEPVCVFDHLVIPAGSKIRGRVAQVDPIPRTERAMAIANGDFTPLHKAHLDFDTLILQGGARMPLRTAVFQGAPTVVHFTAGGDKNGSIAEFAGKSPLVAMNQGK